MVCYRFVYRKKKKKNEYAWDQLEEEERRR